MSVIAPLVFLIGCAVFVASLIGLIFKRFRRRSKFGLAGSVAAVIIGTIFIVNDVDADARKQGFADSSDRARAKAEGVTDPTQWAVIASRRAAVASEERRQQTEIANRQAEESRRQAREREQTRERLLAKPDQQVAFLKVVEEGQRAFKASENDFQRGATRPVRSQAICNALSSVSVSNWIGRVSRLSTNNEGLGVLGIDIGSKIIATTWNNKLSDMSADSLIAPNTAIYQRMGSLKSGDLVRFTGSFVRGGVDCIQEQSMTIRGSMVDPEFTFVFRSLDKVELPSN